MNNIVIAIHQKIIELKNDIEKGFIKLGAYLKEIRDKELYKELSCETFESYLAQPELAMDRRTAYSIIGVYTDFYESGQPHIEGIGYTKLDRIRQFKNKENFPEWIEKARVLSLSDLNAEIRENKGESETTYTPKKKSYTVTCPYCKRKFQHLI